MAFWFPRADSSNGVMVQDHSSIDTTEFLYKSPLIRFKQVDNHVRPHRSLGYITPLALAQQEAGLDD